MGVDSDLWERYGLEGNPYFIHPLQDQTLDLFRGRDREEAAERLVAHVRSGTSSLLLLESGPGVGKTTLVNYAKAALSGSDRYYVYPERIELSRDSSRETLAAEFLSALTTTALTTEPEVGWTDDPRWEEAHDVIAETWENSGFGLGGSFAGFGASLTRTQVRKVAREMPWSTWVSLVEDVLEAMLERRDRVVLHVNNLDAVSDEDPDAVRRVFDESRELLVQEGLTMVLCASPSFRNDVISDRQRLLDVTTPVSRLTQLEPSEFLDAVAARYEYMARDQGSYTRPVRDEALASLYSTFDGDMRNTFQVAQATRVEASLTQTDADPLDEEEILALYRSRLEDQYERLPESERTIVDHLLSEGTIGSQSTLVEAVGVPQPTVSQATRRIENKRWLRTERDGSRLRYLLSGYGELLRRARKVEPRPDDTVF